MITNTVHRKFPLSFKTKRDPVPLTATNYLPKEESEPNQQIQNDTTLHESMAILND